ncbi:MAG: VWA domain-containing protein, partial [Pseudomonadota bacterium]
MQSRREEASVFSTSALDLFASSLGAFILIVLILFPHYNNEGPAPATSEVEDQVQKRRADGGRAAELLMAAADGAVQVDRLEGELSSVKSKIEKVKSQIADLEKPAPTVGQDEGEESGAEAPSDGVEFSILGLETNAKSFVILVDLSGSMVQHADLVRKTLLEILEPLTPENSIMIVGYHQIASLKRFPLAWAPAAATPQVKSQAARFVRSLSFSGGTPTSFALQQAMTVEADAIILISDGEPTDGSPANIIQNIGLSNSGRQRRQIHTVAIGEYTGNQTLTRFLMEIARQNGGNFVGVLPQTKSKRRGFGG